MAYVRQKDRLPLIEPSLQKPHSREVTLGLKKKIPKAAENPYGDEGFTEEIITYYPAYTQEKRVERIIESDEVGFRREKYPTMAERIDMEKEWNKTLMKEARREALAAETWWWAGPGAASSALSCTQGPGASVRVWCARIPDASSLLNNEPSNFQNISRWRPNRFLFKNK